MATQSKALAMAGVFMCMTAAMHITAVLVSGLAFSALFLLVIGLFYFTLGRGFLAGQDHWAAATFGIMVIGMVGAYAMKFMGPAVPTWWLTLIIWTDLLVALSLILFLIRRKV